jgi:hypothetical protein
MTEIVLETMTLPEPIIRMIHTEKVKVREKSGDVLLTPIIEEGIGCPLLGMFSDGRISVERFMERKQLEKELEG